MGRLLLLFVLVPAAELALLIEIGRRIGTLATLGLIVITGVLGAYLARRQGLGVLRRMRQEVAAGRIPAGPVVDGVIILVAGAVLMTPGVLTDAFGFFCLIPACRELLKTQLRRRLQRAVRQGRVVVSVDPDGGAGTRPVREVRDITPREPPGAGPRAEGPDEPIELSRLGRPAPPSRTTP